MTPKSRPAALADKWDRHRFESKLVNPANRRRHTRHRGGHRPGGRFGGLVAGRARLPRPGFCIHDSPRRAHSIAAQGGINAAKNYQNDGDSIQRLFYDTIKGGDYRAREANVYRLAQLSVNIIDQCVAQGVPFAREYGGQLDNRSFGGAQVSRTFYARGQTGQQLLLGAYQSMMRQVQRGTVELFAQREMLDLVIDRRPRARHHLPQPGHRRDRALRRGRGVPGTGGYGTAYYLSTNAVNSNVTAAWRAHKRGALFANPCFTQIHPTCIPVSGEHQSKLTLMSESLRNDGRVWVPKAQGDQRHPERHSRRPSATTTWSASTRASATWFRATWRHAMPRPCATKAAASATAAWPCTWISATRSTGSGPDVIAARYGNLFDMYRKITDEDPYREPMRIYPAIHYTMGGLWVDYNLMSNVPGLHVLGEANFSDHGANRLGASALMQGLADGYFVIPYTLAHYVAATPLQAVTTEHARVRRSRAERAGADRSHPAGPRLEHAARAAPRAGPSAVGRSRDVTQRRRACSAR